MQKELDKEFGDWSPFAKVTIEAPTAFTGDMVSFCNPRLRNNTLACGRVIAVDTVSGLCVVALSRNLILTTTLDRAITQSPCYKLAAVNYRKTQIEALNKKN